MNRGSRAVRYLENSGKRLVSSPIGRGYRTLKVGCTMFCCFPFEYTLPNIRNTVTLREADGEGAAKINEMLPPPHDESSSIAQVGRNWICFSREIRLGGESQTFLSGEFVSINFSWEI